MHQHSRLRLLANALGLCVAVQQPQAQAGSRYQNSRALQCLVAAYAVLYTLYIGCAYWLMVQEMGPIRNNPLGSIVFFIQSGVNNLFVYALWLSVLATRRPKLRLLRLLAMANDGIGSTPSFGFGRLLVIGVLSIGVLMALANAPPFIILLFIVPIFVLPVVLSWLATGEMLGVLQALGGVASRLNGAVARQPYSGGRMVRSLGDAGRLFNRIYGWRIVALAVAAIVSVTVNLYNICVYLEASNLGQFGFWGLLLQALPYIGSFIPFLLDFVLVAVRCHAVTAEAAKLRVILPRIAISPDEEALKEHLLMIQLQTDHDQVLFNAAELFDLNKKTTLSLISAIATYLVILVQLS